jgi:hypothetical protein
VRSPWIISWIKSAIWQILKLYQLLSAGSTGHPPGTDDHGREAERTFAVITSSPFRPMRLSRRSTTEWPSALIPNSPATTLGSPLVSPGLAAVLGRSISASAGKNPPKRRVGRF